MYKQKVIERRIKQGLSADNINVKDRPRLYKLIMTYLNAPSKRGDSYLDREGFPMGLRRAIVEASNYMDFYPTPDYCITLPEIKDVVRDDELTVLEPSAGMGNIMNQILIENKKAKITAIEFASPIYDILKRLYPDQEIVNANYFKINIDKPFDLIICNPPFTLNNYKRYYMDFLLKCLYDMCKFETPYFRYLIFYSPLLGKSANQDYMSLGDILNGGYLTDKNLQKALKNIIGKEYSINEIKYFKNINYDDEANEKLEKKISEDKRDELYELYDKFDYFNYEKIGECQGFGGTKIKVPIFKFTSYRTNETSIDKAIKARQEDRKKQSIKFEPIIAESNKFELSKDEEGNTINTIKHKKGDIIGYNKIIT